MDVGDALLLAGVAVGLVGVAAFVSFSVWMRRYGALWFVRPLHAGRYEVALRRLKTATRWDYDLAGWEPMILLEAGRPAQARERLLQHLMAPQAPAAEALSRFLLAQALLDLGEPDACRTELDRSARLLDAPHVHWLAAELALRAGHPDGATVAEARAAVDQLRARAGSRALGDPEPVYRCTAAWALAAVGDPEARQALAAAEARLPSGASERSGCAWRLGRGWAQLGEEARARTWWERGASLDPDGADGARCREALAG